VHAQSLIARPPFFVGGETELMQYQGHHPPHYQEFGRRADGGEARAAQELRLAVVMIARPALPPAHEAPWDAIAALKGRVLSPLEQP
jgi:precorrin-6A/cobalt-precorrin-6A reductase